MLVPMKYGKEQFVYVNPDYVTAVFPEGDNECAVYMSGDELPIKVLNSADTVYGMFEYYALMAAGMVEEDDDDE